MGWQDESEPGNIAMAFMALGAGVMLTYFFVRQKLRKKLSLTDELWRSVFRQ